MVLHAKEAKQRYLEGRINETEERNAELTAYVEELQGILEHTLTVDDTISFESLLIRERFTPAPVPHELVAGQPRPQEAAFLGQLKPPSLLERALGLQGL